MMSKTCHCIYKQKLIKCQRKILSRSCPASAGLFLWEEVDCWPCSPLHGHGQAPVRHGAAIKKRRIQFVFTKLKQKFQDKRLIDEGKTIIMSRCDEARPDGRAFVVGEDMPK